MRFEFISSTIRTVALVSAALVFAGCSLYEGPSKPRLKEMNQGNLGCLKDVSAKFKDYFEGKTTAADVNHIADCSISALRTFQALTRGENRDRFTAEEVRNFLQYYFLDDVVFSDVLLKEMMRVKQALVGGKVSEFTGADIDQAETLINVFRSALLTLQPYMPLNAERIASEKPAFADAAARAVIDVGSIFGKHITVRDSIYSFEEMGRLSDEVSRTFKGSADAVGSIRENLKLSGIIKELLISPNHPRGSVTAAEWQLIFTEGSRWLALSIKMKNLQAQFPEWTRGEGRNLFTRFSEEGLDLLDTVISRHCPACKVTPGIPLKLMKEVIENLNWDGTVAGIKFRKKSLQNVIDPMVRRIFGGIDRTDGGRAGTRLTQVHTARMRLTLREWADGMRYLEGVYIEEKLGTNFDENAAVRTEAFAESDARVIMRKSGNTSASAITTAEGLKKSYSRTMALTDVGVPGVVFDGQNSTRPRLYRELVRYTWLKPFLRRAIVGYMTGEQTNARERMTENDGLSEAEFTVMVRDFWPLLLDFRFVGPKNTPEGEAKNRFRESSLFMQISDGNGLISLDEGVQLILYGLSADPMGAEIHSAATKLCPKGKEDDYGAFTLEPTCYRKIVYQLTHINGDTAVIGKSFPLMVRFYRSLSAPEKVRFEDHLEAASRNTGQRRSDYFGSESTDATIMIIHYVEALFLRFDKNSDGFINRAEADAAFPIFRTMLAEKSEMDPSDKKLRSVFYWLLAKGNPPVSDDMSRFRRVLRGGAFIWWHWTQPEIRADRLDLISVFATLSQTPEPTASRTPPK